MAAQEGNATVEAGVPRRVVMLTEKDEREVLGEAMYNLEAQASSHRKTCMCNFCEKIRGIAAIILEGRAE